MAVTTSHCLNPANVQGDDDVLYARIDVPYPSVQKQPFVILVGLHASTTTADHTDTVQTYPITVAQQQVSKGLAAELRNTVAEFFLFVNVSPP